MIMAILMLAIIRLATISLFSSKAWAVTMEGVKLVGETNSYINIKSHSPNRLICTYRTGYDDPVLTVNWYKDGRMAYTWNEGETISTAYGDLIGKVATSSKPDLKNIYFIGLISVNLSGNYTCEVVSERGTVKSKPFHLVVLDIPSDDYVSNVVLMSEMTEENPGNDQDKNCTLIWDFKTPAIFPRPNVTCGYYSYLHDDVTDAVPAGLTMHLLNNGSWQAGFVHTHVQVAKIPPQKRLGCAVSVPDTSFKKVIKFEDNFVIDYLIDSVGCPLWFGFDESRHRPQYHYDEGADNCRGDLVPVSNDKPLKVRFWCKPGEMVVFPNGTVLSSWSREMICDPIDFTWKIFQDERHTVPSPIDVKRDFPNCMPNPNSGHRSYLSLSALSMAFVALVWHRIYS